MDVWGESVSPVRKWHSGYENFLVLWRDLFHRLENQQLGQIVDVMYKIWLRRNKWVFDQKFQSPVALYRTASDEMEVNKEVAQLER